MKERLVSFKTAKLAKEKGFNEPVYAIYTTPLVENDLKKYELEYCGGKDYYNYNTDGVNKSYQKILNNLGIKEHISASTQNLLQQWLREKYNLMIQIDYGLLSNTYWYYILDKKTGKCIEQDTISTTIYEDALEYGLQEVLKYIENE